MFKKKIEYYKYFQIREMVVGMIGEMVICPVYIFNIYFILYSEHIGIMIRNVKRVVFELLLIIVNVQLGCILL